MTRRLLDSLYDRLLSRVGLGLLASALLINIGALLTVDWQIGRLEDARAEAGRSRAVTTEILVLQSLLYESESAQRGFLYTGDQAYLAPLNENDKVIVAKFERLQQLTTVNAAQSKRVAVLRAFTNEKVSLMNRTVAVQEMGQSESARKIVLSDRGRQLMESIDTVIAEFLADEDRGLQQHVQAQAVIQLTIRWGFAAIFFINALLILAGAVTIMRGMARETARHHHDIAKRDEREAELASEVVQRAVELRALSVHLLSVQEEERRTIARELHDELGGTLSAVKMDILMGRDAAAKRNDEKSVARLQRAMAATDTGIQFIRRLIEDLRPTLLDNLGFEAALRSMVEQFCGRTSVHCVIDLPEGELNITSAQSTALYRICQEALTNVMKYAKARQVTVTLRCDGTNWTLLVKDDGVGLDATKQHRVLSHGLLGMRERMVALGGTFDIRGPAGEGTTLTAIFPISAVEPAES